VVFIVYLTANVIFVDIDERSPSEDGHDAEAALHMPQSLHDQEISPLDHVCVTSSYFCF
jgi:hypothetical protein